MLICLEHARNMHGIPLENASNMHEYAWNVRGILAVEGDHETNKFEDVFCCFQAHIPPF